MQTDTEKQGMDRFAAAINGSVYHFHDPEPDARQMLNSAGLSPADECILIEIFNHGSRAIGLDEVVDLRATGIEEFRAFRSDRIYRFTLNERGFDWGEACINESTLRKIGHVGDDEIIVLERQDEADRDLGANEEIRLADAGTEHFRTAKRTVTVYFKDQPFQIARGVYTTEQLIGKFPIEEGYLLNLKTEDGELVTLKPGQEIRVKDGMHFYSQVPGGGSS